MIGKVDYVELGLGCASLCRALDRDIFAGGHTPTLFEWDCAAENCTMLYHWVTYYIAA